jgi:ATP-dependent RNA helicase RhlE
MLDMGFLPDIKRILRQIPAKRQTLFFSATMPAPIADLASEMLTQPVTINLQRRAAPAVVFTRTKHRANRLADHLIPNHIAAERIHGNRSQNQRTQALAGFKTGRYSVLVATDIASRGIDVEALSHVVNFDAPAAPDDYIHRVGRTGRAELPGDAFTFASPQEGAALDAIERAIHTRLPRVTLPEFDYRREAPQLEVPRAQRMATMRAQRAAPTRRRRTRTAHSADARDRAPQRRDAQLWSAPPSPPMNNTDWPATGESGSRSASSSGSTDAP